MFKLEQLHSLGSTVLCTLLIALACGCSGEDSNEVGSTNTGDATSTAQDAATSVTDAGPNVQDVVTTPADGGMSSATDSSQDISTATDGAPEVSAPECPGAPGCSCADNSECDNGLCIEVGTDKVCAKPCVDSCAVGFSCAAVNTGGGDTANFCVPRFDRLCAPCSKSEQCKTLGFGANACMDRGAAGDFCGVTCADDSGCPADYACTSGKTVEGATTKQCLPKDGAGAASTACDCTAWAKANKAATSCKIETKNDKGELVASCPGTRACDSAGLSKCVGAAPDAESCNGKDDDCDGKTDEQTCDDNNPCTADGCDPTADSGKGACVHNKTAGPCDADGTVCTENDKCISGVCTPGKTVNCADGNACTNNACDPAAGCTVTDASGDVCDDDNPCTIGDVCSKGSCEAGKAKTCATTDACSSAKCNLANGKCKYTDKPDGSICDDSSKCTSIDACKGGSCTGKAKNCDDGNACTDDACKANAGCSYSDNKGPCEDGSMCTSGDLCAAGKCKTGAAKSCDDANPCTQRSCNPDDGKCLTKKLSVACNDGSKCTEKDTCGDGFCTGTAVDCDDGNPCTTDSCTAKIGCSHTDNALPCNDSDKCTEQDVCGGGKCAGLPIAVSKVCDDGNPCTTETCLPAKGCAHKNNSALCSDGNVCTSGDRCKDSKCVAGTNTCACEKNADCAVKEDGNLCNGTLYCDKSKAPFGCKVNPKTVVTCPASGAKCKKNVCVAKTGKCGLQNLPDASSCDADGSVCTTLDKCVTGSCTKGKPLACNDGKVCTDDSCEPKKGCLFIANAAKCDADGSVCTQADMCAKGLCLAGPKKKCDDGNICTDDSCDKIKGCRFIANTDGCDDGDPCTVKDTCAANSCGGAALSCDDTNPCTADSCKAKSGCVHQPQNSSCEDGDACTVADKCGTAKDGKWGCTGGKPKDCDDGNVCTVDGCAAKTGCTKKVDTKTIHACYSGPKGTAGTGTCSKGKASCKADGTIGACIGEVVPAKIEQCDGKDDDCDAKTDEGCKTERATLGFGGALVQVSGGKYAVRAWTSGSATVGRSAGAKYTAWWGFDRWLRALGNSK